MPKPQYVFLDNMAQFGKYIEGHIKEIIDSSIALAKLEMNSGSLKCTREIFSKVTTNEWGEGRILDFYLTPTITCE